MDPIIEEMSHHRPPIRPEVWAHWMNYLLLEIQPRLDRLEQLEAVERNQPSKSFVREHIKR